MARGVFVFGSAVVVLGAVFWQLLLRDLVFVTFGVGRVIQKLDDFPYKCRPIKDKRLSGCEDLWLDDEERILYAACAGKEGRLAWNEAVLKLNVSARRDGGSELLALSIDETLPDGSFPYHSIKLDNFRSPSGDSSVDLLGFDVEVIDKRTAHFYLTNQRPPVDAHGKIIDATKLGANATIEVFEHKRGAKRMKHLRTIWDPETVYTPNNIAALGNGAFVVTNDHSKDFGLRRWLDNYIGGGGVTYCSSASTCFPITPPRTFRMPNGLALGADGLIYVPATITGTVSVYSLTPSVEPASIPPTFTLVDTIQVGMPLDNFALDANGDLLIPGFPNGAQLMKWVEDPVKNKNPATVWKIKKVDGVYELKKVLEDREAEVLNGITAVRHDVKTGRLFMGAVFDEFVVCDPIS